MKIDDSLELVAVLAEIGRTDRELYRQLRAEAWDLIKRSHGEHTASQRIAWLKGSS